MQKLLGRHRQPPTICPTVGLSHTPPVIVEDACQTARAEILRGQTTRADAQARRTKHDMKTTIVTTTNEVTA